MAAAMLGDPCGLDARVASVLDRILSEEDYDKLTPCAERGLKRY